MSPGKKYYVVGTKMSGCFCKRSKAMCHFSHSGLGFCSNLWYLAYFYAFNYDVISISYAWKMNYSGFPYVRLIHYLAYNTNMRVFFFSLDNILMLHLGDFDNFYVIRSKCSRIN